MMQSIGDSYQKTKSQIEIAAKKAGKKTGKDQKKGKATLIRLLGHKNAIKYCNKIIVYINQNLKKYGSNSQNLFKTLNYILDRNK